MMMRRGIFLLAAIGLAACDVVTEPPSWEQEWQVPVPSGSLALTAAELLPEGVTVNADSTAFITTAPGAEIVVALSEICPTCAGLSVATKPEFRDTLTTTTEIPADLLSATLQAGAFDFSISHDFNFDPLRPSDDPAAERGFLVVSVLSDGQVISRDSISGEDTAFPGGTTLTPDLEFGTAEVGNQLQLRMRVYSPTGDATTFDANDDLTAALAPTTVGITEATVAVPEQAIGPEVKSVSLAFDPAMIDRVQNGALLMEVRNPFDVTGLLDVAFQLPDRTIQRAIPLAEGTTSERVAFSGQELRDILAADDLELAREGSVAGTGGTVTVSPGEAVDFDLELELIVLIGGSPEED